MLLRLLLLLLLLLLLQAYVNTSTARLTQLPAAPAGWLKTSSSETLLEKDGAYHRYTSRLIPVL